MNKELNYPVKYAVLELKEIGGYSQGWEDITKGFIASKCFVVESKVKYLSDGSSKVAHKVVFPHKDYKTFKVVLSTRNSVQLEDRITPQYNAISEPYPVNIVTDLFDTYEDAKEAAEGKNKELYRSLTRYLDVLYLVKNLDRINQEYASEMELCSLFEKASLEETKDMVASYDREIDKTIKKLKREKSNESIQ